MWSLLQPYFSMCWQVVNPSPVPLAFVVYSGDQIISICSFGIPTPVSWKLMNAPSSVRNVLIASLPPPCMAWTAFRIKFMKTLFIKVGSTVIFEASKISIDISMSAGTCIIQAVEKKVLCELNWLRGPRRSWNERFSTIPGYRRVVPWNIQHILPKVLSKVDAASASYH